MWYKVKITREVADDKGKLKNKTEYYLSDVDNFAEAGYRVMNYFNGECEIEDVQLLKNYKPAGNEKYADTNKVFIVKFAVDFAQEDGSGKTQKYPVPFYADDNSSLQEIIAQYMRQGLDDMRVTTTSETKWEIV